MIITIRDNHQEGYALIGLFICFIITIIDVTIIIIVGVAINHIKVELYFPQNL